MNVTKTKYLVKCEIPGCENIAMRFFSAGSEVSGGVAVCDKCVRAMYSKIRSKNEEKD